MRRIKKSQEGSIIPIKRTSAPDLRTGQYKRLGRLSTKNPTKAKRVAKRMVEKATRTERGEEYLKKNISKFTPDVPTVGKRGLALRKKMGKGGSLKPVDSTKNPGLAKLPTAVRNKMGYQKHGGKTPKNMKGGGRMKKCRGGCY